MREFFFLSVVFIDGYLCIKIVRASTRRRFYFDIDFLWKRKPLLRCVLSAAKKFQSFFHVPYLYLGFLVLWLEVSDPMKICHFYALSVYLNLS